jgi:hypothetical protein
MIENLFISRVRIKMLNYFLMNEDDELHVRGLVRLLEEEINAVRRELQNLEDSGILTSQKKGNKLFYRIDHNCPILKELQMLFYKERKEVKAILRSLRKIEGIDTAFLTENFITDQHEEEYDIDLMIVGNPNVQELTNELKKFEKEFDRELRITVMSHSDIEFHHKKRDDFLLNVMRKDRIMLIGSNKDLI